MVELKDHRWPTSLFLYPLRVPISAFLWQMWVAHITGRFTDFGSCSAWSAIVAAVGEADNPLKSSERRASCLPHLAKGRPDMGHQTVITQCETWATSRTTNAI